MASEQDLEDPSDLGSIPWELKAGTSTVKMPTGEDYEEDQAKYVKAAWKMLNAMSSADRLEIQNILWKKGLGSSNKPSTSGLTPADTNRFAEFLAFSRTQKNKTGATATPFEAYNILYGMPNVANGPGTSKTFTAKADVSSIFSQVAERDLGRKPTAEEMGRFFDAYHSMEGKATQGNQAPSVGAAAESQLKTTNAGEVQATGFADYARAFQDMLRGA
jgi:hypothetical protein